MNIFAVSPIPQLCAQSLDNRRLVKMTTETLQILCTATGIGPYRPTHASHPVVKWCGQSIDHANWAYSLLFELGLEYTFRFGKTHSATAPEVLSQFSATFSQRDYPLPRYFQNSARNVELDLDFTHLSVHDAYREYLLARWHREFAKAARPQREYFDGETIRLTKKYPAPTWGKRGVPDFFYLPLEA